MEQEFSLNAYLMARRDESGCFLNPITGSLFVTNHIVCKDGFTLSVQASESHMCRPRSNMGPWETVEVACVSDLPEFILEWAADPDTPEYDIFPNVPIEMVEKLIMFHGGPVD